MAGPFELLDKVIREFAIFFLFLDRLIGFGIGKIYEAGLNMTLVLQMLLLVLFQIVETYCERGLLADGVEALLVNTLLSGFFQEIVYYPLLSNTAALLKCRFQHCIVIGPQLLT